MQAAQLSQAVWTGGVFYLILCAARVPRSESGTSSGCAVLVILGTGAREASLKEGGWQSAASAETEL